MSAVYVVTVTEITTTHFRVTADSPEEAERIAEERSLAGTDRGIVAQKSTRTVFSSKVRATPTTLQSTKGLT